jgi:hypothetical protein
VSTKQTMDKIIEKFFEDPSCADAEMLRTMLVSLVMKAKAEQHIKEMEQLAKNPIFKDCFFTIDSWR